mmetsp:Transcript_40835/g.39423  ORF Transcript_40835/g.39423 Transcript_40835/m.39423 type:complete len:163 (+) Transcript_40835:435-923(+)
MGIYLLGDQAVHLQRPTYLELVGLLDAVEVVVVMLVDGAGLRIEVLVVLLLLFIILIVGVEMRLRHLLLLVRRNGTLQIQISYLLQKLSHLINGKIFLLFHVLQPLQPTVNVLKQLEVVHDLGLLQFQINILGVIMVLCLQLLRLPHLVDLRLHVDYLVLDG